MGVHEIDPEIKKNSGSKMFENRWLTFHYNVERDYTSLSGIVDISLRYVL